MWQLRWTLVLVLFVLFASLSAPLSSNAAPAPASPLVAELPHDDALLPPDSARLATTRGLSQYMAGHVAVGIILPESDGSIEASRADWSPAQIAQIEQQVQAGLSWWQQRLPLARLHFSLETRVLPTGYEPVEHGLAEEHLWIGDTLGRLGYQGNYFDMVYAAAEQLRQNHAADWATLLFVANSEGDADRRFSDRRFAYAYINGPMIVMTSGVANYGADQFGAVFAHEFGHTFGALDQYVEAGIACDRRSGYLNAPTNNSMAGACSLNEPSIMREISNAYRTGALDPAARAQVGYYDSDNDGVIVPLDTVPMISLDLSRLASAGRPLVSGTVVDEAFPSAGQVPVSLNTVQLLEFRVNGGDWQAVVPLDGAYDTVEEQFAVELPLYDGQYQIEFRARNEAGLLSASLFLPLTVEGVGSQPAYALQLLDQEATAARLQITAPADTQALQISPDPLFRDAEWQTPEPIVNYALSSPADVLYVRFRDAMGQVSLAYCQHLAAIETPTPSAPAYEVFLPLLFVL